MKWFKHFSSARFDTKIKRLIKRYGLEGYGLYFMVVESVAFQLETNSLGQSKLKTIEYLGWLNPFRCFVEDYLGGVKIGAWSGDGDYPDNYK